MNTFTVWKNRDNSFALELQKTDPTDSVLKTLTTSQMQDISKVEILFNGTYYDSDSNPSSFDWSTYESIGVVVIKLGIITGIETGRDKRAELIIYNSENTNGVIWKVMDIEVKLES